MLSLGLLVAALVAAWWLDLSWRDLIPGQGGWTLARNFFEAALNPALEFQGPGAPSQSWGVLREAARGAGLTVVFAAAAMSLALPLGLLLGVLGSTAWWEENRSAGWLGPLATGIIRPLTTLMRSVHELAWAVLLLAALGGGHLVAVVALAIPYTGTLAKVFAEMLDEAPREAPAALVAGGAGTWQAFLFGQMPLAGPDMIAYAFYRFECALRSSAVLGFFGFPTLGYYIAAAFENLHYGEVWTHLYCLFGLVLLVDWWSGRLRRELVS